MRGTHNALGDFVALLRASVDTTLMTWVRVRGWWWCNYALEPKRVSNHPLIYSRATHSKKTSPCNPQLSKYRRCR